MTPIEVHELSSVGGAHAAVLAFGTLVLGLLVVALAGWRWRAHATAAAHALAAEATGSSAPLVPGPTTLVGRVAGNGEPPVTLRIHEAGEDYAVKGGWRHRWRERSRRTEARPFVLVRGSGERIRVEPGRSPRIVDDLRLDVYDQPDARVRVAEIARQDVVRVSGTLERRGGSSEASSGQGGYREASGPARWVLTPPPGGAMLLSTKPLVDAHRRRAVYWRAATLTALVLLAVQQGVVASEYYRLRSGGRLTTAEVVSREERSERDRDGRTHVRRAVWFRVEGGPLHVSSLGVRDFDRVAEGDRVVVLATSDGAVAHLGTIPRVALARVALFAFVWLVALVGFVLWRSSRRRWWERPRVVTTGAGRLAEVYARNLGDEAG